MFGQSKGANSSCRQGASCHNESATLSGNSECLAYCISCFEVLHFRLGQSSALDGSQGAKRERT
eukprot:892009-Pyramimonas_sp.AAC.1